MPFITAITLMTLITINVNAASAKVIINTIDPWQYGASYVYSSIALVNGSIPLIAYFGTSSTLSLAVCNDGV